MAKCGFWVGEACVAPKLMSIPVIDDEGNTWAEMKECPCKMGTACTQCGECPTDEVA